MVIMGEIVFMICIFKKINQKLKIFKESKQQLIQVKVKPKQMYFWSFTREISRLHH